MDWREDITTDPNVCHGEPCIRGTRLMVSLVLDSLAEGVGPDQIHRGDPSISLEAVQAAIAYAAQLARERVVILPSYTWKDSSIGRTKIRPMRFKIVKVLAKL